MKEAIQTLITSDKMAHAFEYLKQDEAHTIDQQIELVQISSFSPFEEKRAIRFKELLTEAGLDPVMDEVHNVYAHIMEPETVRLSMSPLIWTLYSRRKLRSR